MKYLLLAAVLLSGCTTTNDAYIAAQKSQEARVIAATNAQAKSDSDASLALGSALRKCTTDLCVVSLTALAQAKTSQIVAKPETPIAPPQNEVTEFIKAIGSVAAPIYGMWSGAVLGVVNATRGPADSGTSSSALNVLTPNLK